MQCTLHNKGRIEKNVCPGPLCTQKFMIAAIRTRGKKEAEMRVVHAAS
jgi:hypothetical protein